MNQQQQNYLQQQQQQGRSYGDMHIRRKTSERESSVEYVGGQVKKIAEQVANEKQTIRERLEELEERVDRIGERSEKFQKIGKLLQSCVDGQEDDLKKLRVQVYEDIETKCKVLEAKFDVDTKLMNQESSLNKKFNQRVRDLDTMAEGIEARIQENYQEFSGEMATQIKSIEDSVEKRADQLRREIVALFKDFEKETRYDSLKKEIDDFKQGLIELRQKQKLDVSTAAEKTTSIVSDISFMTKAISEISQNNMGVVVRVGVEQNSIDDEKSRDSKKQETNDLKQMVHLLMGKVDRMEKQKVEDDKQEEEHNKKLLADIDYLKNKVRELQHQNTGKQNEYLPSKQQQTESPAEQTKIVSKQADKYSLIAEKLRLRKEFAEEELIQPGSENDLHDQEFEQLRQGVSLKQPQREETDGSQEKNNFEEEYELGNTFEDRLKTLAQKREQINEDSDKLMHKYYEKGSKAKDQSTKYTLKREEDEHHIDKLEQNKPPNKDVLAKNNIIKGISSRQGEQLQDEQNKSQNSDSLNDSIEELFNRRKDILAKKPAISAQAQQIAAEYQEKQLKAMGLNNSPVLKVDEILSKARPSSTKNSRSIDESLQQMTPCMNGRSGSASDFKAIRHDQQDNSRDWKRQGRQSDQIAEEMKGAAGYAEKQSSEQCQEDQKQEVKIEQRRIQLQSYKSDPQHQVVEQKDNNKYQGQQQEQLKQYLEFSDNENESNLYNKEKNNEKIEQQHAQQLEKEEDELLEQLQERRNRLRQFIEQTEQQLESEEEEDQRKDKLDQPKHQTGLDKQQYKQEEQQYDQQSENDQEEEGYQRGRDKQQRVDDSADLIRLRNRIATAQNYTDSQSRSRSRDDKQMQSQGDNYKIYNKKQKYQEEEEGDDADEQQQIISQTSQANQQNKRSMNQQQNIGQVVQQAYKLMPSNSPKQYSNNIDSSFHSGTMQHHNNKRNSFQYQQPKQQDQKEERQTYQLESSDEEIEQALQKYQNTKLAIGQLPKQTTDFASSSQSSSTKGKEQQQIIQRKEIAKTEPQTSYTPQKDIYQYPTTTSGSQQSMKYNQIGLNKQNSRNNSFTQQQQDNSNNQMNFDSSSNSSNNNNNNNRNRMKIVELQMKKGQSSTIGLTSSHSGQKDQRKYQTEHNEQRVTVVSGQNDNYFSIGDRTRSLLKEDDDDDEEENSYAGQQAKNKNNRQSTGDSLFYTKGLKYDVNFSTNQSKMDKGTAKNFEMIDKVMKKSSQKLRK